MNVAVLGCGAIGGVIAACLTRAGARVTPITGNPAIALALARDGLRVRELNGATWSVPPSGTPLVSATDAGDAAPAAFDLVVAATQSTRLEPALESIRGRLAPAASVVVCQNGLPEDRAARVLGPGRVIGCVVSWGASMVEPGLYQRTSRGASTLGTLGEPVAAGRPGPAEVARLLEAVAPARRADDFAGVRWSKLAINCCTTTIGAIGGSPLGALLRHRFARRLALEVLAEVGAVARAEGVRLAPVGGTLDIERVAITEAERHLRLGSPSLFLKHSMLLAVGFKYRRLRSSMLYALERGRPPEIDHLNGEVVRRGERHGVPTPVNRRLVDTVRAIAAGRAGPGLPTLRAVFDAVAASPPPADERPSLRA